MGIYKRSDMCPTEMMIWDPMHLRWLYPKITTKSESVSLTKWLKKNAPRKNQDKMKSNHQPDVYLMNGDDHANSWGSTNLDRKGKNAPVWNQMCDRLEKSNGLKSSIIRSTNLVIRIHNPEGETWQQPKRRKNMNLIGWLQKGSTKGSW